VSDGERESAVDVRLSTLTEKIDAVHLSLKSDMSELKAQMTIQDQRVSKAELRMAQVQGAGVVLTLALPFAALGLQKLIGG
jgi:uncharacterized protein YlxW (UPF0749 family)